MNDLGMTMAWLAVQVTLVLGPAMVLYAMAARRGPAAGAWVAAMSLVLVLGLNAAVFAPGFRHGRPVGNGRDGTVATPAEAAATPAGASVVSNRDSSAYSTAGRWPIAGWRVAWSRFERGAAEPAERVRSWGRALAVLFLAGIAVGSVRLVLGLGAVVACRRRGKAVGDAGMIALLDELRSAIGCRSAVELREVPDLPGPATAGWLWPVILLPDDWRSWDDSERRAVLAHELAHIVRGDYAVGLMARLALALNGYHPMVRWMASQLRLQQELAADAFGARYAGSRSGYLVALSRLALRQDGRSACWPARAFLPARGTLIRRITMLRDQTWTEGFDRSRPRARRVVTAAFLFSITAAVMALRGPARGGEEGLPVPAAKTTTTGAGRPSSLGYHGDHLVGVVAFRPAAACRRAAKFRLLPADICNEGLGVEIFERPEGRGSDTSGQDCPRLDCGQIEWVSLGLGFGRAKAKDGKELHAFRLGGNITVRMVAPFDWLAFLRRWHLGFAEARDGGRVYYRVTGPLAQSALLRDPCVYLPDDRTMILDQESAIRKLARGEEPPTPAYLRGPEWERASQGVMAIAIGNEAGAFEKAYDLGRPDDAVVRSMFNGVDQWIFSLDDADAMVLRAAAVCGRGNAQTIAETIADLVKQGRESLDRAAAAGQPAEVSEAAARMWRALLANLRVEHSGCSIAIHADGFGTLADFAAVVEAGTEADQQKAVPKGSKP